MGSEMRGDSGKPSPRLVGIAVCLLDLADKGIRIIFVTVLSEGWLFVTRSRVLLIDESLSPEDQDAASRHVLASLVE